MFNFINTKNSNNYKKAISLIEVIIAITLLSFVIVVLLNLKEQNFFLLNKVKNSFSNNTYLSPLVYSSKIDELRNENIYLSDVIVFKDDDNNRFIKKIKINVKDKLYSKQDLDLGISKIEFTQIKSTYKTQNSTKIFYTFKIKQ